MILYDYLVDPAILRHAQSNGPAGNALDNTAGANFGPKTKSANASSPMRNKVK